MEGRDVCSVQLSPEAAPAPLQPHTVPVRSKELLPDVNTSSGEENSKTVALKGKGE